MLPQTIVFDGYDGTMPKNDKAMMTRIAADLDEIFPDGWRDQYEKNNPEVRRAAAVRFEYHLFMPIVVNHHNEAVPIAQRHARAAELARRAVVEVDGLYADLGKNTTVNWLAAHHRFILACKEARRLLTEVVDTATALHDTELAKELDGRRGGLVSVYYGRVPTEQRITIPDVEAAGLALSEFVETTGERIDTLRATVSGGYPEGFAPAVEAVPMQAPEQPGPDGDWDGDWPASRAVVAGEGQKKWREAMQRTWYSAEQTKGPVHPPTDRAFRVRSSSQHITSDPSVTVGYVAI